MPSSKELTEKWYAEAANRGRLAVLLNDPVMQHALRIVVSRASEPVPPPSCPCDLMQYGAMMGFTRNGAFETLKNLEDLSKSPPRKPVDAAPFDREAQEKLTGKRPTTDS